MQSTGNFLLSRIVTKRSRTDQILELIEKGREKKEPGASAAAPHVYEAKGPNLASQFPLCIPRQGRLLHLNRVTPAVVREHDGEQQEDYLWGV